MGRRPVAMDTGVTYVSGVLLGRPVTFRTFMLIDFDGDTTEAILRVSGFQVLR